MRKIILTLVIFSLMIGSLALAQMEKGEDIMTKMPQPEFLNPKEGEVLQGKIKIEVKVKEI